MSQITEAQTYWARIYIAGNRADAERVCRQLAFDKGACVTVTPTEYVYSGGQESGVIVGLINYPRFPSTPEQIDEQAQWIAAHLVEALHQRSYTIETPTRTVWHTRQLPFETAAMDPLPVPPSTAAVPPESNGIDPSAPPSLQAVDTGGVETVEAPSMVGVGTDQIVPAQPTHGAPHLYGVKGPEHG
jgi:hypothetical protein